MSDVIRKEPLSKKELKQLYRHYMLYGCNSFDYVYYQGKSWIWWLKPFFKKFYNKKGYAEGLSRHFDFYNTEPVTASLIYGIILGLEERRAIVEDVDEDTIKALKVGLQGPVAGIGDSLIQATLIPILITIALSLCGTQGSIAGPIFYLVAILAILIPYSWILYKKGYHLGASALDLLGKNIVAKITKAVSVFGLIVIGCLAASRCGVSLALQIESDGEMIPLQNSIDEIFPNLLSMLTIFLLYWLMKYKKVKSTILVYVMIAVVVILSLLKIV